MSWKKQIVIGVLLMIVGVVIVIGGMNSGGSVRDYLNRNPDLYPNYSPSTYGCRDPQTAYEDLDAQTNPAASKAQANTYYLRYRDDMVTIRINDKGSCEIYIEDNTRVNNGHFVFLGTGFRPGSPSGSSGGSGGSFFGSK